MSFHWDLSDDDNNDEEGEEKDWWTQAAKADDDDDDDDDDDGNTNNPGDVNDLFSFDTLTTKKYPPVAGLPSGFGGGNCSEGEGEDDDGDSVDWEDADKHRNNSSDNDDEGDQKLAAKPTATATATTAPRQLQPVTINIGASKRRPTKRDEAAAKKKRQEENPKNKTRRSYKFQSLPRNVQFVLEQLHQAHWLALTCHILFTSSQCSNELVLPVAFSIIPSGYHWNSTTDNNGEQGQQQQHNQHGNTPHPQPPPSLEELRNFGQWYFELIHNAEDRRQETLQANAAAGAPRLERMATTSTDGTSSTRRAARTSGRCGASRKRKSMTATTTVVVVDDDATATTITTTTGQVSPTARLLNYCAYLAASQAEDPQLWEEQHQEGATNYDNNWTHSDDVNLFIAMTRSLGWRTRYVAAIEPVKKDLDLDHPMLQGAMTNVFRAASSWKKAKRKNNSKNNSKKMKATKGTAPRKNKDNQFDDDGNDDDNKPEALDGSQINPAGAAAAIVGWAEVLCRVDESKARKAKQSRGSNNADPKATPKQAIRWAFVDPSSQAIDEPGRVESYLFEQRQDKETSSALSSNKNYKKAGLRGTSKKRHPVAFAMAAEHNSSDDSSILRKRLTDVTPRYAFSMLETLKLRGFTPKQQARVLLDQKNVWWSKSIKALNNSFKGSAAGKAKSDGTRPSSPKGSPLDPSKGKSKTDAIDILSDGEEAKAKEESEDEGGEDDFEKQELAVCAKSEALPTSKEKFRNHPLYAIASVLKSTEVLAPDAKKRVRGFFKGEMVYSRSDVSEALAERKWLYEGQKVRKCELKKPVKRVKARAKSSNGGEGSFKALKSYGVGLDNDGSAEQIKRQLENAIEPLGDGMKDLYGMWQTDKYKPPYVGPNDIIPVNEYKNVELALINPGLVHIAVPRVAKAAKTLGVPYAPCLLGFEGHGGNRTPTIRGIVVHQHNADLLREASVEVHSKAVEDEHTKRRTAIYTKWKKLLVGALTKERLEREYG